MEDNSFTQLALQQIRQKLLDLTRRNRLLNYRDTAKTVVIRDELPNVIYDKLLSGASLSFSALDEERTPGESDAESFADLDTGDLPEEVTGTEPQRRHHDNDLQTIHSDKLLQRRLLSLLRDHNTIIEETGGNDLYLIIGVLEFPDPADANTTYRAPLVLLPVHLKRPSTGGRGGRMQILLQYSDEAVEKNYSLSEKLRMDYGVELPDLTEETLPEEYLANVNRAIADLRSKGWRVARRMAVGLLSFAKLAMWRDLDPKQWPTERSLLAHPLIQKIIGGSSDDSDPPGQLQDEYYVDHIDAAATAPEFPLITEADVSQYTAIVDAVQRDTGLVIEGPPGTGKSQTITNLIATFISQGKRVLFVAEKMAALRVVYDRLEKVGLGRFCLQLHGQNTSKKEVLAELDQRLKFRSPVVADAERKAQELKRIKRSLLHYSSSVGIQLGPVNRPLFEAIWHLELMRRKLPEKVEALAHELSPEIDGTPTEERFLELRQLAENVGLQWKAIPQGARQAFDGWLPYNYREAMRDRVERSFTLYLQVVESIEVSLDSLFQGNYVADAQSSRALFRAGKAAVDGVDVRPLPTAVTSGFVQRVLHLHDTTSVRGVLDDLDKLTTRVSEIDHVFDYRGATIVENAVRAKIVACEIVRLWSRADVVLRDLKRDRDAYSGLLVALGGLPGATEKVSALTGRVARTIADCEACVVDAAELKAGPGALLLHSNPNLCRDVAKVMLGNALTTRKEIELESRRLSTSFVLSDRPEVDAIDAAAKIIQNNQGIFAFLRSEYRAARRTVKGLLAPGIKFAKTTNFTEELNALVIYYRQRAAFAESRELRSVFGGLFQGVKTDWSTLGACIEASAALKQRIGADAASTALSNWEKHCEHMSATIVETKRHLAVVTAWLSYYGDRHHLATRPLSEILSALAAAPEDLESASAFLCDGWCNSTTSLAALINACDQLLAAKKLEKRLSEHELVYKVFASDWNGIDTRSDLLRSGVDWIDQAVSSTQLTFPVLAWLIDQKNGLDHERLRAFRAAATLFYRAFVDHVGQLRTFGELAPAQWVGREDSLPTQASLCRQRLLELDHLTAYARWVITQRAIKEVGLTKLSEFVTRAAIAADQCADMYEFALYDRLVREAVEEDSSLRMFASATHEDLRRKFSALDQEVLRANAIKIQAALASKKPPEGVGNGAVSQWTERRLIVNEIGKKQRHIPIRQLMRRAGEAIRTVKPCFLMSPLSVARYLDPATVPFDVVIMDEASQIRPEDALGAIARARKVIIVGDPKQLPPTNFYERATGAQSDEDASAVQDSESILDVSLKQFPYRRLRWHYRSQHERLIQFSNEQFYDRDLIIVPSPLRNRRDAGVHCTFVANSTYNKGRNRGEAEVVVANVIRHFQRRPKVSLGVAAFNLAQAEEIQALLDNARREDRTVDDLLRDNDSEKEPLFIKNLENVQGDERDVIFISTTYGPESTGQRVFQRFGPINSDLGWRRLNVIATRAKQRVEVFTSMRPTDIIVGPGTSRGLVALRNYIEYAMNVPLSEVARPTGGGTESPFEQSVLEILQAFGYRAVPQVGVAGFFIDIGVVHPSYPGEYLAGIECDGAAYHSSKSVRDRDRLRQEILEAKGWVIHRIWSTSWLHMRASEIARLRRALDEAVRLFDERRQPVVDGEEVVTSKLPARSTVDATLEQAEAAASLREALELYRDRNIGEGLKNTLSCVLSDKIVHILVERRPETMDEWQQAVPHDMRMRIDRDQMQHLDGILEIVGDYPL